MVRLPIFLHSSLFPIKAPVFCNYITLRLIHHHVSTIKSSGNFNLHAFDRFLQIRSFSDTTETPDLNYSSKQLNIVPTTSISIDMIKNAKETAFLNEELIKKVFSSCNMTNDGRFALYFYALLSSRFGYQVGGQNVYEAFTCIIKNTNLKYSRMFLLKAIDKYQQIHREIKPLLDDETESNEKERLILDLMQNSELYYIIISASINNYIQTLFNNWKSNKPSSANNLIIHLMSLRNLLIAQHISITELILSKMASIISTAIRFTKVDVLTARYAYFLLRKDFLRLDSKSSSIFVDLAVITAHADISTINPELLLTDKMLKGNIFGLQQKV